MPNKTVHYPRKLFELPAKDHELIPLADIAQWMKEHYCQKTGDKFKPFVHYNFMGDFFELYWSDDDCYAEPVENLTLMKSFATGKVVGVQFYQPKQLMGLIEVKES